MTPIQQSRLRDLFARRKECDEATDALFNAQTRLDQCPRQDVDLARQEYDIAEGRWDRASLDFSDDDEIELQSLEGIEREEARQLLSQQIDATQIVPSQFG